MRDELLSKIRDRRAVVGVVGLGYVGLPLAMEFAGAGFHVIGYDVSERVCRNIMAGKSHIQDIPDETVARHISSGTFQATTDEKQLQRCDAISIAVPTPLSKTRDPDMSYVNAATETVARNSHPGMVIVLESTTYPGTTREVLQPRLEQEGRKVGVDTFLAFSPERVDPGNPTWHTKNTPKVVGGITQACSQAGARFYEQFLDTIVPVSSAEAAELTKILENTFRAVNIGLVNETAIISDRLGVDVWEVIDAAATKPFGFMKFTPGPGLGGHCIPVDPHYLSWKMRSLNYKTRFIELASEINAEMPIFVVDKIRDALNRNKKAVNGSHVLVMGVAYKRDIDDVRESPALDVMRLLEELGADVAYHDPYVPTFREDGIEHSSVELSDALLKRCDAVVIVTDHSSIDYQRLVNRASLIVDTRNATRRATPGRARVVSLSTSNPPTAEEAPVPANAGKVVA